MPPFELREGQGTLHRQDKEGNEQRPDYRGELNVGGKLWKLAGWVKISKNGDKWLSLSAEEPRPKAALETPVKPQAARQPSSIERIDPDSDVPF